MTLQRAGALIAAVLAAFVLSGCFVVSNNLPGAKETFDERIPGAWRGFDKDDQKDADAFLHFLEPDNEAPLKLVWVEGRAYQVYEVRTYEIAGKNVFASKLLTPMRDDGDKDEMPDGYFLGFYEFNGADEMTFTPLDAEKVDALIKAGKVKGLSAKRKYDFVTLTGSPAEIAAFLGSPEAQAAGIDDPPVLRRVR